MKGFDKMSAFEEAVWLSCEKWVDSFPTDIPKHHFSEKHNEIINEIIYGKQEKTKHKLSKGTIKVLLIAVVLLAFATTVFAVPASREYIIEKFFNHSEYSVIDNSDFKKVTPLNLNYIPTGFEKVEDYGDTYLYRKNNKFFTVQKCELSAIVDFDTEKYERENIKINGADAVYFRTNDELNGVIFNNGKYIFIVNGNISKDDIVNIAQNAE